MTAPGMTHHYASGRIWGLWFHAPWNHHISQVASCTFCHWRRTGR